MSNFFSFKWLSGFFHIVVDLFHKANKEYIDVAINATNVVKTLLTSPIADWAVALTATTADNKILDWLKSKLPLILADELAFKNLSTASTPEDVQAFLQGAIDTFGTMTDAQKEQLWTSIAANIYKQLEADLADNILSFGEAASLVQTGWSAWQKLHATQEPATASA